MRTDMAEYAKNAVEKFKRDGKTLRKVISPYFTNQDFAEEGDQGLFSSSCASHEVSLLFFGRVARPDISVAAQRLCRGVTKLTTTHGFAVAFRRPYLNALQAASE